MYCREHFPGSTSPTPSNLRKMAVCYRKLPARRRPSRNTGALWHVHISGALCPKLRRMQQQRARFSHYRLHELDTDLRRDHGRLGARTSVDVRCLDRQQSCPRLRSGSQAHRSTQMPQNTDDQLIIKFIEVRLHATSCGCHDHTSSLRFHTASARLQLWDGTKTVPINYMRPIDSCCT